VSFELGEWVHRRYGSGAAQWGRITGRIDDNYDCWYVTSTDGSVYHDNGRDLFHSTQPPNVSDDFAFEAELKKGTS
jgi:hypothetical protein